VRHWGSLLTNGAAIAAIGLWEHLARKAVSARLYGLIASLGVLISCYGAWADENIRANRAEKAVGAKPSQTDMSDLRSALKFVQDETLYWNRLLGAWGTLQRGAKPKLTPERWLSALQTAASLGTDFHGELLKVEDLCRRSEREIADICAIPDSLRLTRQGQISQTQPLLLEASRSASEALKAIS